MRISFDLPDHHVKVLAKWASVSRTLRTAESCCEDAGKELEEVDLEKYQWCAKELDSLVPALDQLHQSARSAIWCKQNPTSGKRHRLKVMDIHVDPKRPPRNIDPNVIDMIKEDIQKFGQEVPILVVPREDGTFTVVDGILRFKAIKLLGWVEIDAIEPTF
jgi:hypothetical protein